MRFLHQHCTATAALPRSAPHQKGVLATIRPLMEVPIVSRPCTGSPQPPVRSPTVLWCRIPEMACGHAAPRTPTKGRSSCPRREARSCPFRPHFPSSQQATPQRTSQACTCSTSSIPNVARIDGRKPDKIPLQKVSGAQTKTTSLQLQTVYFSKTVLVVPGAPWHTGLDMVVQVKLFDRWMPCTLTVVPKSKWFRIKLNKLKN